MHNKGEKGAYCKAANSLHPQKCFTYALFIAHDISLTTGKKKEEAARTKRTTNNANDDLLRQLARWNATNVGGGSRKRTRTEQSPTGSTPGCSWHTLFRVQNWLPAEKATRNAASQATKQEK
ncbi:uncharacterized protein SPSK_08133 [Sporothrix schenckii 1099-18]|uniref:Uncharacterized protein n=1 Tax=Sporothrix schenckii 1099-18 TaxID=1397361 RepID=A0A0F2ME93_SPOSC|nr:uncharacterized protein SPSK_08133 [Sporothrix schenckii 1099-18]KJR87942.1 hypothetical protein SPSK_08133 [Sporothrix schenckii 1099-18]